MKPHIRHRDPYFWYQLLEDQSRTDHIYDLIHYNLQSDWEVNHDFDLCCVQVKEAFLKFFPDGVPAKDISTCMPKDMYAFDNAQYVIIANNKLTEYLEKAKAMHIISDFYDREFIELVFEDAPKSNPISSANKLSLSNESEAILYEAYQNLRLRIHKAKTLELAKKGHAYLNNNCILVGADANGATQEIMRQLYGYNIVAMVYAWHGLILEASKVDESYVFYEQLYPQLKEVIEGYLILLLANKEEAYLEFLFAKPAFKNFFFIHYEVYVSLFLNEEYEWINASACMSLISVVKGFKDGY